MCEVCAAGGLRELREEVKAARHTENKLVREVRRLEEQLLSRQASAKTRSQVETLAPGGGKAASSVRALEIAEYQQRLREAEQENAELRRQVERYQRKLVGLQKAAWEEAQDREEGRETPAHSNVVPQHSIASQSTHNTAVLARLGAIGAGQTVEDAAPPPSIPKNGSIGAVKEALLREDQARREWLRAAGKLPGGQSRIDVGSHSSRVRSIGVQASTRIPRELICDDFDIEGTAEDGDNERDGEGSTMISALKAELHRKNALVQALQVSLCAPSSCTRFISLCVDADAPARSKLGLSRLCRPLQVCLVHTRRIPALLRDMTTPRPVRTSIVGISDKNWAGQERVAASLC